jgi:hypothetical protein
MKLKEACDKYGIGCTALWKNLKKVPSNHSFSDAELGLFIDGLVLKSKGQPALFTPEEIATILTMAAQAAAKLMGECNTLSP